MDTQLPACPLGSHCWGDSCPSPLHKDGPMADTQRPTNPYPEIKGHRCPACGGSLFVGEGGYITCSWYRCPSPDYEIVLAGLGERLAAAEQPDLVLLDVMVAAAEAEGAEKERERWHSFLTEFAGVSADERRAIDQWCNEKATEDAARRRRGLEENADRPLAVPVPGEEPADHGLHIGPSDFELNVGVPEPDPQAHGTRPLMVPLADAEAAVEAARQEERQRFDALLTHAELFLSLATNDEDCIGHIVEAVADLHSEGVFSTALAGPVPEEETRP